MIKFSDELKDLNSKPPSQQFLEQQINQATFKLETSDSFAIEAGRDD